MLGRFLAEPDRAAAREEPATIVRFDEASRAHTVRWRGTEVGPIWSANGLRHAPGASVRVLVKGGLLLVVIP